MGRHGTGGSDDGDEGGSGSAFWGPDEPAEAPGWPALPDQVEVTGQWAPMPRREDAPPPRGPQPEPFETTGAFAVPTDVPRGFPPSDDPGGAFPPPPAFSRPPEPPAAGPFEVTGAFARPADWDSFDPARNPPPSFDASGRTTGPFDEPGRFDQPGRSTGPFDQPGRSTGPFDQPGRSTGPFGAQDGERTARFDAPAGPDPVFGGPSGPDPVFGAPPEPGDVKVAGEPTAVHTPAWAEAETGFLRSGWSSDNDLDDLDEPEGARGRRRRKGSRGGGGGGDDTLAVPPGEGGGRGKGRMALLSVAAVAVVLGGTVAGVKFMSSSGTEKCAEASCAAVQTTGAPSPTLSGPDAEESDPAEDEPTDEPTEEESGTPSDAPSPTTTYANRAPRRSTTPTPKPTRSKTKQSAQPTQDDEMPTDDDLSTDEPTPDPTSLDNSDSGVVPTVGSSAAPTNTVESAPSGGSVAVRQTVKQRMTAYSATLHVTNQAADPLENATFSVPVEGRVTDVDGASWTQDGDLLIVDLPGPLPAGETLDVTYTATGKAQEPGTCGLVGGECAVA